MQNNSVKNNISTSVIDLQSFNSEKIYSLFESSLQLKNTDTKFRSAHKNVGLGMLVFFEPSTRTRFSFEAACARAGIYPMVLDGGSGTSLEKGETMEDTILNLEAMRPLFFVIRCPDELNLQNLSTQINTPIINAGWGKLGHPTQALLDSLTLFEKWGQLKNKNILFVGDVRHSRVVSSHLELGQILSYNIGYSAPQELLPTQPSSQVQLFAKLEDGLKWADAVVILRVQKERHQFGQSDFSVESYRKSHGVNTEVLKNFKSDGMILHPGPINYGVELEKEVLADKRSVILKLVENGVFVREMLIRRALGEFL